MLRLKKLRIEKFRGLAPTELEFSDGINVLLGKNGTGKTTLLELISAIVRSDFSFLSAGECRISFVLQLDDGSLSMELQSQEDPDVLPASARADALPRLLSTARGAVTTPNAKHDFTFELHADGRLTVVPDNARTHPVRAPSLDQANFLYELGVYVSSRRFPDLDAVGAVVTSMSNLSERNCVRFDEGLDYFRVLIGETSGSPPTLRHIEGLGVEFAPVMVPSSIWREPIQVRPEGVPLTSDSLERLAGVAGVERVDTTLRFAAAGSDHHRPYKVYSGIEWIVQFDEVTAATHRYLSYGQKRLFAFWYYLACNEDGVIAADELVNGLHHSWIQACLEEIGERQAFLASQNPLLLDYLTFGSAEDVRKTFVRCTVEKAEGGGRLWQWRKPDAAEAELFYRSYEVGIRHVSEILRTQGLW